MAANQQSHFGPLWMKFGTHDLFFWFFWVPIILFRWKTLRSECLQFSMDGIKFQISKYNFDWNQFALNSRDHGKISESLFQLSTIFKNNHWQRLGIFSKYSLWTGEKTGIYVKTKYNVELLQRHCMQSSFSINLSVSAIQLIRLPTAIYLIAANILIE